MALTQSTVVDTALDLLADSGLPGMSMRTLAGRLGVQPSALYWHFPSKQVLLTAVAERILARVVDSPPASGSTAAAELADVARALRAAVTEVPDGAEIVALGLAAGAPNPVAAAVERVGGGRGLRASVEATTTTMTAFVLGLTIEEQTHHNLRAADPAMPDADYDSRFEAGLDALLAGLAPA